MATENKKEKEDMKYQEMMDIPQVTLQEAYEQLKLSLDTSQQRGVHILVGESGLGKTQIVQQIARETGRRLVSINTSQFAMMGAGVPQRANEETGLFKVAVPSFFPDKNEKCIVMFDEINQGLPHAISMFYNMLEDRKMFDYTLPEDTLVVGAMNPSMGAYAVTTVERSPAFRRRIKFMYVIPDFKGWYQHASSEKFHANSHGPAAGKACHPAILSFLKARPKCLYDTKSRDAGKLFMCPATVETVSEDAYNIEHALKSVKNLHGDFAQTRFAASIGNAMATQLCAYIKDSSATIGADDVLKDYPSVQLRVAKLKENGGQEKLSELQQNVAQLLFATSPEVDKAAKHLLAFMKDLPDDLVSAFSNNLRSIAQATNSSEYYRKFLLELGNHTEWEVIQLKIDKNHRAVASALSK